MTEHCASPAHKEASSAEGVTHDAPAAPEHPSAQNPDPGRIYISEVQRHQARYRKLIQFTSSSTKAAGAMLLAAIAALVVANSPVADAFSHFWHTDVGFVFGQTQATMPLSHVINDVLMAVFFLLVGLEIKYEMTVGELTNIRQAILPIVAAVGGVLVPVAVYSAFNVGNLDTAGGWGVPTATDIAFALGILALLGNRVPNGVRVFLSTLAVADDIIAIIVIAVFYGQAPSLPWLGCAAVVFCALLLMNKRHVFSLYAYLLVGAVLWYCVFMSGVHSTIAGVLLAFAIPSGSRVNVKSFIRWTGERVVEAKSAFNAQEPVIGQEDYLKTVSSLARVSKQVVPPATRLEHLLYPWVYFAILPLFALTNANVGLAGSDLGALFSNPALLGAFFGLVVGKPLGIMAASFLVVKLRAASLPENVTWMHMLGAAVLGGVGFTMAIFVANLAYVDTATIAAAKLGILLASLVAGVAGFSLLAVQAKSAQKQGVAFMSLGPSEMQRQTAGEEANAASERLLREIDDPEVIREVEQALAECEGIAEVAVSLKEKR